MYYFFIVVLLELFFFGFLFFKRIDNLLYSLNVVDEVREIFY